MSDKPLGPGWWQASDGSWHPPELHPSAVAAAAGAAVTAPTVPAPTPVPPATLGPAGAPDDGPVATVEMPPLGPVPPQPVPSLDDVAVHPVGGAGAPQQVDAGPMFPDLFQQAVAGSRLADTITVHFADGEHRESLDVPASSGPTDPRLLVPAAGAVPPGEVGEFIGASAKKRRWHL